MEIKVSKIIYFIEGLQPSESEAAEIAEINSNAFELKIRTKSASLNYDGSRREECAFVAGAVPANYSDKPVWEITTAGDVPLGTMLAIHDEETKVTAMAALAPFTNASGDEVLGVQVPLTNVLLKDGQEKTIAFNDINRAHGNAPVVFSVNTDTGHLASMEVKPNNRIGIASPGTTIRIQTATLGAPLTCTTIDPATGLIYAKPYGTTWGVAPANSRNYGLTNNSTTVTSMNLKCAFTVNGDLSSIEIQNTNLKVVDTTNNVAKLPNGDMYKFTVDAKGDIIVSDVLAG